MNQKEECEHNWINVGMPYFVSKKEKGFLGREKHIPNGMKHNLICIECGRLAALYTNDKRIELYIGKNQRNIKRTYE